MRQRRGPSFHSVRTRFSCRLVVNLTPYPRRTTRTCSQTDRLARSLIPVLPLLSNGLHRTMYSCWSTSSKLRNNSQDCRLLVRFHHDISLLAANVPQESRHSLGNERARGLASRLGFLRSQGTRSRSESLAAPVHHTGLLVRHLGAPCFGTQCQHQLLCGNKLLLRAERPRHSDDKMVSAVFLVFFAPFSVTSISPVMRPHRRRGSC